MSMKQRAMLATNRFLAEMGKRHELATPLDIIMAVARGDGKISDRQLQAAIAAAPYLHPKLTAVQVQQAPTPADDDRAAARAITGPELAEARALLARVRAKRTEPEPVTIDGTAEPEPATT